MTIGVSNYGWNPMLWPSYSGWSSMGSGAAALSGSGLSAATLSSIQSAEATGSLFGGTSSAGIYDSLSISPTAYSMLYNADNTITQALGQGAVSAQTFFAQAQQTTSPLLSGASSTSANSATSLLTQAENSTLESTAPGYYLNTFNPYSYLGNTTATSSGNLFNTLA